VLLKKNEEKRTERRKKKVSKGRVPESEFVASTKLRRSRGSKEEYPGKRIYPSSKRNKKKDKKTNDQMP